MLFVVMGRTIVNSHVLADVNTQSMVSMDCHNNNSAVPLQTCWCPYTYQILKCLQGFFGTIFTFHEMTSVLLFLLEKFVTNFKARPSV